MPLILGRRRDGSPIWPLAGGAPDDDDDAGSGGDGGDGGASGSDGAGGDGDGLGEAGRRAIEAERAATRRARDELRPWKALGKRLGLTPEQIEDKLSQQGQQGKDEAAIRREVGAELAQKANARLVRAEVKALAAATFQDPSDVPAFLHLEDYEVDDEGNVDTAAIERDLKKLLTSKPYLGKQPERPGADFEGGARGGAPRPKTMNELIRGASRSGAAR